MIPVYLVTLKETPWKHEATTKHLNEVGISPRIVWGIHGMSAALKSANPYEFDEHGNGKWAPPSTLGCSLSHLIALTCAVTNDDREFIIFEDDVKLDSDFIEKWKVFRKKIPDWVDVVQLDHAHHSLQAHRVINDSLMQSFYPFGSGAIWWTKRAAEKAIQLMRPINGPYDCLLIRHVYPFLKHACAVPKICDQRSGNGEWSSTIGSSCWMSEYENAKGIPV